MKETLHIYTRVSSRIQDTDGTSLDTQKESGVAKSKELGMKSKVWNEGGKSSSYEDLQNRPKLMQLLGEIESGSIKHLYVWNNDRLSRNDITQQTIKIALQRNDVILYTKDGQFDLNNPQDKLMKTMLDGISVYENALRAERSRLGKIRSVVGEGSWLGGPPVYGYKLVDKKLTVHREESKWVKRMFRWFYDGKSIIWIKSQLDTNGVIPRRKGKTFNSGSINKLLQNTHYIGYYTWTDKKSGETYTCSSPQIVDETIWNEVQEKRKRTLERKGQNNRTQNFYLLRNLMWCGECGSNMRGRINPKRYEQFYYCPNKEKGWKKGALSKDKKWKRGKVEEHGCDMNRSLNIPITDKFVWETVIDTVSQSSVLKEKTKKELLHSKFSDDEENEIQLRNENIKSKRLMKELQQVQSTIGDVETNNLLKKYDADVYARIKSNLDAELKNVKDNLEQSRMRTKELGTEKLWLDWIAKYGEDLEVKKNYNKEDKKEYLQGLIDRIEVGLDKKTLDHKLTIIFKMGLVGDGIEYINPDSKKDGYRVVEGKKNAPLLIPNVERRGRKKKSKNRVEYTKDALIVDASSKIPTYHNQVLWSMDELVFKML